MSENTTVDTPEVRPSPGVVWTAPPPRPPGFLQLYWPGPGRAAPVPAIVAIVVGALLAAFVIPLDRNGIGWFGTGVVLAVLLGLVARRPATPPAPGVVRWRRIWGGLTLALLAVGTVRAAGWLFTLCVLTAIVTGSLALGSGSTVAGLVRGALAVPFAGFRALPWGVRGFAAIRKRDGASPVRMALTIALSMFLLLIFGALFASADAAFAKLLGNVLPAVDAGTVARWIFVGLFVGFFMLGGVYLVQAAPKLDGAGASGRGRVRRLEWALPVALLDLLFAAFVLVQLTVLFGGARHVLANASLTYAEYARGGFWQLLLVTMLTLVILGAAARWAPREQRADRVLVRVLLGLLAALTLVIVASALYRMSVYEEAYGFTQLRVFVTAVEIWLGAVFLMIMIAGVLLRGAWLPRAVALSAVLALLGLAVADPDRLVADRNIDRYAATGKLDLDYLHWLSADAAPAMERLPKDQRDCALSEINFGLHDDPDDWRGFNLARWLAHRQIVAEPLTNACPAEIGRPTGG